VSVRLLVEDVHDGAPSQTTTGHDPVNHPVHYNSHPSGIECIEIARHYGFNVGNVIKYLWRAGLKNSADELEDLKKALWYLQDEIKLREQRGAVNE
jgi:hypothetical protein